MLSTVCHFYYLATETLNFLIGSRIFSYSCICPLLHYHLVATLVKNLKSLQTWNSTKMGWLVQARFFIAGSNNFNFAPF